MSCVLPEVFCDAVQCSRRIFTGRLICVGMLLRCDAVTLCCRSLDGALGYCCRCPLLYRPGGVLRSASAARQRSAVCERAYAQLASESEVGKCVLCVVLSCPAAFFPFSVFVRFVFGDASIRDAPTLYMLL